MGKKWFYALKAPQRDPDDVQPPPIGPTGPEEPQQVQVDVRGAVVVQSARGRGGYAGVSGAVVEWHPTRGTHARPGTTRSSRGGAFSLRLGSGVYIAEVVPPAGYQPTTKTVRVHPGMERTLLVLKRAPVDTPGDPHRPPVDPGPDGEITPPELPRDLTLALQVFGRDGRRTYPLGAAQIRISGRRRMFMTDRGGRLRVPLPAGRYDVMATKSGFNMARRQVMLSRRNASTVTIYLDRQPTGGGGEITPPPGGGIVPPPIQRSVPLQLRVMVRFPKPAKRGQPAGWTTTPAKGANIRITRGRKQVFAGRADKNGYLGTNLQPGNYQIQVTHGKLSHNEALMMGKQRVRKTITIRSGALLTPPQGPILRTPRMLEFKPGVPLQRRVK